MANTRGGLGSGACSLTSLSGTLRPAAACVMPLLITSRALVNPLGVRSRIVPVSSIRKPGRTTPSDAENETSLIFFLVLVEICRLGSGPAAIDCEAGAVDEGGFVRSQVAHH